MKVWSGFFVLMAYQPVWLFNDKTILIEEQQWYYFNLVRYYKKWEKVVMWPATLHFGLYLS